MESPARHVFVVALGGLFAATALVSAVADCAPQEHASAPATEHPVVAAPPWLAIAANDTLRTEIDTSRLRVEGAGVRVWVALVDVSTRTPLAVESPFRRFETEQEVDCQDERSRNLLIRTPDTHGVFGVHRVRDSTWRSFEDAGLPVPTLHSVCVALARLGQS